MNENIDVKSGTIKRIGGYLHKVIPIADKSGEIISYALKPMMVEFKPRDVIQVIIGSSLIAVPVSLSEEAWTLAETLPNFNLGLISLLSFSITSLFVYYNFYRNNLKGNVFQFVYRVIGTYLISFAVAALMLTIIQKCPWETDHVLAIKRTIIVAFPATFSGTLSDTIK